MALADVTTISSDALAVEILASTTTVSGIPTAAAGVEINALRAFGKLPDAIRVLAKSTAGSGTMTASCRVWLRHGSTIGWSVAQCLAAPDTTPQVAGTIAETGADTIAWSEVVPLVAGADRIFLELLSVAGTATAIAGYAIVSR